MILSLVSYLAYNIDLSLQTIQTLDCKCTDQHQTIIHSQVKGGI